MPSIGSTNNPVDGSTAPSYKPTEFVTESPTEWSYNPTIPAPAVNVTPWGVETPVPTEKAETDSPSQAPRPTPMPIASFAPPQVLPESTNFPTGGSTPTVSTEVTGELMLCVYYLFMLLFISNASF